MSKVRFGAKEEETLEEAFESYKIACYAKSLPLHPVQEREIRQAFIAGIIWINGFMAKQPDGPLGDARYNSICNEIKAFAASIHAIAVMQREDNGS